jgi:hypothetical protein
MRPSQISRLHREIEDSLDDSIGFIEADNVRRKGQVKELEEDLIPMRFLSSPLVIAMLATHAVKLKGSSSLLTSCRGYVENNIKTRMELITKAWETSQTMASLGTREHNFLEHLQTDLKNEKSFHLDTVIPFGLHVNNMTDMIRRQHDIPSKIWITQLKAC